jgi:hypothetical protein
MASLRKTQLAQYRAEVGWLKTGPVRGLGLSLPATSPSASTQALLVQVAEHVCEDWQRADDLVQATATRLFTHWGRVRVMDNIDGYVRTIMVRCFLGERRSGWSRKVTRPPVGGERFIPGRAVALLP